MPKFSREFYITIFIIGIFCLILILDNIRMKSVQTRVENRYLSTLYPAPTPLPTTEPTLEANPIRSPEPQNLWQTYINSKYGYSINHPSYWTVDDQNSALVYLKEHREGEGAFFNQTINIGVYPDKGNLTFMQFLKDIFYANNNVHDTSMVGNKLDNTSTLTNQWLSGVAPKIVAVGDNEMETIGWVPNLAGSYGDGYWVTHNNNGYFILFSVAVGDEDKTTEPDEVLSTFRFTQ